MRIMGIVKYAGTGLAFPSQTMYVRSDSPAPLPITQDVEPRGFSPGGGVIISRS